MDEISCRIKQLRKSLIKEKADAILISNVPSMRYFSGFTGDYGSLLISKSKKILITDGRYTEEAEQTTKGFQITRFPESMTKTVGALARNSKIKNLIFESHIVTYLFLNELKKHAKGIKLIPKAGVAERVMRFKSDDDVKKIKKALSIAEASYLDLTDWVRPGMTEKAISLKLHNLMLEKGAEGLSFPSIIAADANASLPHAQPGMRKVKKNSLLLVDWGAVYKSFCSDTTRVFFMGKVSDKMKKIYDIVREAQEHAIAKIEIGIPAKEVDAAARDHITSRGYGECFGHSLGHGVGMKVHEGPVLSQRSEDIIEPGTVFTIEPGIYLPGWGGVRLEEMVFVSKEGVEILTKLPKYKF